jgi:predicted component of type VI protein secretion system
MLEGHLEYRKVQRAAAAQIALGVVAGFRAKRVQGWRLFKSMIGDNSRSVDLNQMGRILEISRERVRKQREKEAQASGT